MSRATLLRPRPACVSIVRVSSIRRVARRIVTDEYLDLYVLGGTALVFTVLGVTGISDAKVLSSVILALLAFLALSQIRSRRHLLDIAKAQRSDPFSLFRASFPDELVSLRATASSLTLMGVSMARTVQGGSRTELRQMLASGGTMRVLLVDPGNEELLRAASSQRPHASTPERLRKRIEATLDELTELRASTNGEVEIRVASFLPAMGINILNGDTQRGLIVVQHQEHRAPGEAAPIIQLRATDGYWYRHFLAEADRMWEDGSPWPPVGAQVLARSARPRFQDDFGAAANEWATKSSDLLITGVARNTLVNSHYTQIESLLANGCRIRVVLVDPASEAIMAAANRYYVEVPPDTVRERVGQTLRFLAQLKRSTGGDISVKLTSHPLAMGLIAVNTASSTRSDASALLIEYYSYQARGEAKFVLQPSDSHWFEYFLQEAESLWENAAEYTLDDSPHA